MIEQGRIEVSMDGKSWKMAETFTFGNLLNDPSLRTLLFKSPVQAKFVRLISLKGAENKPYAGAAEFSVLTGR